jgi:hypothetical protein
MDAHRRQVEELHRQIEWTLSRAIDPSDVLPMLHRLTRLADDGSDESLYANLRLAELLVERDPWRAALYSRRVLTHRPDDDRGWAILALCQTMLGNYKFAVSAYRRALAGAPKNPWYAHNLGHLLDVALGRAKDAVGWLKQAYESATYSGEVTASYAHALARAGRLAEARRVLARAMKRGSSREHAALLRWIEQGAPADKDHPLPRPAPVHTIAVRKRDDDVPSSRRPARTPFAAELEGVLARGLSSLPLDTKQRMRARSLGRDAAAYFVRPGIRSGAALRGAPDAIAAAIAYAIVYVDHVPLTQSEVAACFRVSIASLRGRFGELRAHLDLLRGDARYASTSPRLK